MRIARDSEVSMVYFHVSQTINTFLPGQVLELSYFESMQYAGERLPFLRQAYPGGVSRWGLSYLLQSAHPTGNLVWELIFEGWRREKFPHLPSRFQSIFAWQDILGAVSFAGEFTSNRLDLGGVRYLEVWQLQCDGTPHFGDMRHIGGGFGWIDAMAKANSYWQGNLTAQPQIEVLLPLPVTVVGRSGRIKCYKEPGGRYGATYEG